MKKGKFDFIIIGGGLAGLSACIHLSKLNYRVLLLERHAYPRHKVCGEYVSNEVLPYLRSLGFDPFKQGAVSIRRFEISTRKGRSTFTDLPLGGFGISRYCLDHQLYLIAKNNADILFETVSGVDRIEDEFTITTREGSTYGSIHLLGAFGKRSNLDKILNRPFIKKRTPWMAVKSHYSADFPEDLVALHNFEGGYCGLSKTETGVVNMCYLSSLKSFNRHNDINNFQREVLSENPKLKSFLGDAESLFDQPMSISQISFQSKSLVLDGIFMLGDSAGLIHPLCGNGMAMAIQSSMILGEMFSDKSRFRDRRWLEANYSKRWKKAFSSRLNTGNVVQRILLNDTASEIAFRISHSLPAVLPAIIRRTHGTPV